MSGIKKNYRKRKSLRVCVRLYICVCERSLSPSKRGEGMEVMHSTGHRNINGQTKVAPVRWHSLRERNIIVFAANCQTYLLGKFSPPIM